MRQAQTYIQVLAGSIFHWGLECQVSDCTGEHPACPEHYPGVSPHHPFTLKLFHFEQGNDMHWENQRWRREWMQTAQLCSLASQTPHSSTREPRLPWGPVSAHLCETGAKQLSVGSFLNPCLKAPKLLCSGDIEAAALGTVLHGVSPNPCGPSPASWPQVHQGGRN